MTPFLPKHIGDVVCAIIERNGKFLIAQRPQNHQLANLWEFPGGKVREGETWPVAIIREIKEELNVDIKILASLTPSLHKYESFSLNLIPFQCEIVSGELELVEHQNIAWVNKTSVADYSFSEADIPILEEYLIL